MSNPLNSDIATEGSVEKMRKPLDWFVRLAAPGVLFWLIVSTIAIHGSVLKELINPAFLLYEILAAGILYYVAWLCAFLALIRFIFFVPMPRGMSTMLSALIHVSIFAALPLQAFIW